MPVSASGASQSRFPSPVYSAETRPSPPDEGERAYVYAKACGITGKSFADKRLGELISLRTISELERLVFPDERHELPGRELLRDLENRIAQRAIKLISSVIKSYLEVPSALVRLLRAFEYADLKTCLHCIAEGKPMPPVSDLGRFGTVNFQHYPDLNLMLKGTEYKFLLDTPQAGWLHSDADMAAIETELDFRYYTLLVQSLDELPSEDMRIASMILAEEISLRNCIWAFRLRLYYKKTEAETAKYLMNTEMKAFSDGNSRSMFMHKEPIVEKNVSLAKEALNSLARPVDQRSAWKGWRWEGFLNPERPGYQAEQTQAGEAPSADHLWAPDPRYFQNAASRYLYNMAKGHFHTMPFSVSTIFCFIKLVLYEEDLLTSVCEGLSLGIAPSDVLSMLEVSHHGGNV